MLLTSLIDGVISFNVCVLLLNIVTKDLLYHAFYPCEPFHAA